MATTHTTVGVHNIYPATHAYLPPVSIAVLCGRKWRVVESPRQLPDAPGCYAVYRGGQLVYIGSSVSLAKRCGRFFSPLSSARHRVRIFSSAPPSNKPVITVKVALAPRRGEWLMREYRLIIRLRPRDNKMHTGSFARRNH